MEYEKVYMVGIGGIGMSALARWFIANGKLVAGYDKTPTPLTAQLQAEGMAVHFADSVAEIPEAFKADKSKVLVVFTPAIPADHQELAFFRKEGYRVVKRSEALGIITQNLFTIAISGTHGKTTTSSMVAHVLKHANQNFVAFLGGLTNNYGSNLIINQVEGSEPVVVVEADEYDRSFLTLNPDIVVVTSVEADHLDIYGTMGAIEEAFADFIGKLKGEGVLFLNHKVTSRVLAKLQKGVEVRPYGVGEGAFRATDCQQRGRTSLFDVVVDNDANEVTDFTLNIPGMHNVENATAAISVCLSLGLEPEEIQKGIASFNGVKRRFEYIAETPEAVYIDDYAHHPTEVEAFIKGLRSVYPQKHLTVIFQPHLYTRTRDFAEGFAQSLSLADEVVLMDIYPARELPIEGVDSGIIFSRLTCAKKHWVKAGEVLNKIKEIKPEVLATVGAGDIDRLIDPIKELINGLSSGK